ncbi:MAG: hypothetical protein ACFHX7_04540 [Pseudomonadota bacterium]
MTSQASPFDDAAVAAAEARYGDVITILSSTLNDPALNEADQVAALTNRAIAYSLMGGFELARRDLDNARTIDPDNALALNQLGILAEQVDKAPGEAARLYEKAAETGLAAAAVNLARLYRSGRGVSADSGLALALYQAAAEQGYAPAYGPIGAMYFNGEGTERDEVVAAEWLQKAVDNGSVEASLFLGRLYEAGSGVARNPEAAVELYRSAAVAGNSDAQNALGYMYRSGSGVERSFEEAVKWYKSASDQGQMEARNRLAWLLAACPTPAICNGEEAVRLARSVVAEDAAPGHLDTLAAALARAGEFDEAIAVQLQAVAGTPAGAGARGRYERRLALYRSASPFQL